MDNQLKEEPSPRNYYYVTQVTNPAQTYFSRIHPDAKRSPEVARKLAHGKRLHNFAGIWFKNLPDYYAEEVLLDGAWVDVPGVRGKVDHRFRDSLLEFKTKAALPQTADEIISNYPHDLEQITFYSVLHPASPKNNYLVFMHDAPPYEIKAFRIEIEDKGTIKSILFSRINLLDKAIQTNDPTNLGRCRFFETGCQYRMQGLCSCAEFEPLNTAPLERSIEITYDEEFTEQLIHARETSGAPDIFSMSVRDIIAPRKHYMETVTGLESPHTTEDTEEFKACLWASLGILKKSQGIDLDRTERQSIIQSQLDSRARIAFRWMKMKSSVHRDGEIIPYIEKISMIDNMKFTKPSKYHLAELGIICALYGKSKGLMIKVFPNLDKLVVVHQITYKKPEEILRKIKSIIDITEDAEKSDNLLSLPMCPDWMNRDGECPLESQCCSNGSKCGR
jgi:hypothetical protein